MKRLQGFLAQQDFPAAITWAFSEDVICKGRSIYVRYPVPEANLARAAAMYELGKQRGLGISFEVVCPLQDTSVCYIYLPSDAKDAEYRMMSALKLCVPTGQYQPFAYAVADGLGWRLRKMFHRPRAVDRDKWEFPSVNDIAHLTSTNLPNSPTIC